MSLVHVHRHHNSRRLVSILTQLLSLNVQLDALAEQIMMSLQLSSAKNKYNGNRTIRPARNDKLLYTRFPIHSNIAQYITCKISKKRLLQHWDDQNLTHTAGWGEIDLTSFKQAQETTTFHMEHFIMKYMSNTLPTMTIIQQQGQATINLCP